MSEHEKVYVRPQKAQVQAEPDRPEIEKRFRRRPGESHSSYWQRVVQPELLDKLQAKREDEAREEGAKDLPHDPGAEFCPCGDCRWERYRAIRAGNEDVAGKCTQQERRLIEERQRRAREQTPVGIREADDSVIRRSDHSAARRPVHRLGDVAGRLAAAGRGGEV